MLSACTYLENKSDKIYKHIEVNKGVSRTVGVRLEKDLSAVVLKGKAKDVTSKETIPETIESPVKKGQKVGEISYCIGNEEIGNVSLITTEDVERTGFLYAFEKLLTEFIKL